MDLGLGLGLKSVWLIVIACLISGCPRAKPQRADLGPEVSAQDLSATLTKYARRRAVQVRLGQSVRHVLTRQIENDPREILLGSTEVKLLDDVHRLVQITKSMGQPDGSIQTTTAESALVNDADDLTLGFSSSFQTESASRLSFHHLRERDETLSVPEAIQARPDCGGLSPCELRVHWVHFEMAKWSAGDQYEKVIFDLGFTDQTPRLPFGGTWERLTGSLAADCRAFYVPQGAHRILVRDCDRLNQFELVP